MSMSEVIRDIEREMFQRAVSPNCGDVCETNLNCAKINQCDRKIDITTSADNNSGIRRYLKGREGCAE